MSQTWTDDVFAKGHAYDTDLQNMEYNFACLKSLFSGASNPSNAVAGMPWFDTTNKVLKIRNQANSAWLGLMHGDASQKVWVYRDSAMDGWVVDSAVTDRVLALKGGTTYTSGAATAGSWTISGLTDTGHTHAAGTLAAPDHTHDLGAQTGYIATSGEGSYDTGSPSATALTGTSASGTATLASDGTWRTAAAVGTLQYLDL